MHCDLQVQTMAAVRLTRCHVERMETSSEKLSGWEGWSSLMPACSSRVSLILACIVVCKAHSEPSFSMQQCFAHSWCIIIMSLQLGALTG